MRTLSDAEVADIRSMIDRIRDYLADDEATQVVVPKEVRERVAAYARDGKCLQCDEIKDEPYKLGCCVNCYQKTGRRKERGEVTHGELLLAGLISDQAVSGRKGTKTKLDALVEQKRLRETTKPTVSTDSAKEFGPPVPKSKTKTNPRRKAAKEKDSP